MITAEDADADADMTAAIRALTALADAGIPPDIQELLVYGNPKLGIAPGALTRAIAQVLKAYRAAR